MKMNKLELPPSPQSLFFLPSLFTLTNLFFGFMSIVLTFHGRYRIAAFWLILAAILDGMDGLVARATHTSSDFGIQLDSLCDSISFGLAASVLVYFWGLRIMGAAGLLFSFLFLTAGLLRLARYNVRTKSLPDRKHYQGLTVPSAAVFLGAIVNVHKAPLDSVHEALPMGILVLITAFLMISTIPYKNYIKHFSTRKVDIKSVLFLAVTLTALVFYARLTILALFSLNVLSGPADALIKGIKKADLKKNGAKVLS